MFDFFQVCFTTKNARETASPSAGCATSPLQVIRRKQIATSCSANHGNSYSDFGVANHIFDLYGSPDLREKI